MKTFAAMFLVLVSRGLLVQAAPGEFGGNYKSKSTARMLSLGGTIVPIALGIALTSSESEGTSDLGVCLIGGGAIVGPGLGHAYADRPVRFAAGAVVRTVSIGFSLIMLVTAAIDDDVSSTGQGVAFCTGMSVYLASAAYDIATVGASVDEFNRKRATVALGVRPTYDLKSGTGGVMLTVRF